MKQEERRLIEELLDGMVGHTYLYGSQQHIIKRWRINDERERVYIMTNRKEYDRPLDACGEFLNSFEPVADRTVAFVGAENNNLPKMQVDGAVISQLKDVLLDNIKKIKEDKNYIPQAESIKSNVDSIIDLAKTEVAYMEAFVRMTKRNDA